LRFECLFFISLSLSSFPYYFLRRLMPVKAKPEFARFGGREPTLGRLRFCDFSLVKIIPDLTVSIKVKVKLMAETTTYE